MVDRDDGALHLPRDWLCAIDQAEPRIVREFPVEPRAFGVLLGFVRVCVNKSVKRARDDVIEARLHVVREILNGKTPHGGMEIVPRPLQLLHRNCVEF